MDVWLIWLKGNEAAGSPCCVSCLLLASAGSAVASVVVQDGVLAGLLQNTATVGLMPALVLHFPYFDMMCCAENFVACTVGDHAGCLCTSVHLCCLARSRQAGWLAGCVLCTRAVTVCCQVSFVFLWPQQHLLCFGTFLVTFKSQDVGADGGA
jgi:hypothetical protein